MDLKYTDIKGGEYKLLEESVDFFFVVITLKKVLPAETYERIIELTGLKPGDRFKVTVPRGYISDLCTLPEWFTNRFSVKSKYRRAFLLQDFLYEILPNELARTSPLGKLDAFLDKRLADGLTLLVLGQLGMGPIRRFIFKRIFKWTAIDKTEARERRGMVQHYLKNFNRIGLKLGEQPRRPAPIGPIPMSHNYPIFVVPEAEIVKVKYEQDAVLQYPNLTIPLYVKKK